MSASLVVADDFSRALVGERPRLVRLCRQMTSNADVAEDLAQETLLEAWRLLDRLREPEGLSAWLNAIARNVCHRWLRAHGRERLRVASVGVTASDDDPLNSLAPTSLMDEMDDLGAEMERAEVAALLERALAPLPATTRALLLASVTTEASTAELAETHGLSEGAVRVRLHRGRQALRRALAGDLRAEAESLDLTLPAESVWKESRIWCPFCGVGRLRYRIDRETGEFAFLCAGACAGLAVVGWSVDAELVAQVSSPKSLVTRHCLYLATRYRAALAGATERCGCGAPLTFTYWTPDNAPREAPFGVFAHCPNCGLIDDSTAWHLALDTAEAQRFWRRNPRMRSLPITPVERDGRLAVVTGFESVVSHERLEIVSDARDYSVLYVGSSAAL